MCQYPRKLLSNEGRQARWWIGHRRRNQPLRVCFLHPFESVKWLLGRRADLATLYRCRWEVETLFRELKTQYELDEFDTSNPAVVEILLYAALLSLLVSRELLDLVTEQADDEIVFLPERWAATFRSHAKLILHELGEYLGYSPPPLLELLIEDAQKIHQQRPILQETLATATQPRCEA